MQEGLDFYRLNGCCFICPNKKIGCWCDICRCHDCYRYTPFKDTTGGQCDIIRVDIKKVDYNLVVVEGVFKLKFGKNQFLPVGSIRKDGFFQTWREPCHFFRKYHGFGLNKEALEYIEKLYPNQCHGIRIEYHGQNGVIHYYSIPKDWFERGTPYKNDIFPHDAQFILDSSLMKEK